MRLPRLPRPHPADVPAVAGQTASVVMVGGWCAWTTYGAAQTWSWLPGWSGPAVAASGGVAAATAVLGGLLYARLAGQQDARRVLQDHREAQARNRAERGEQGEPVRYPSTVGGRHRCEPGGRRVGGWRDTNDQAAIAGRGVVDNAAAHRFELPAGARGDTAAAYRMLDRTADVLAVMDHPAEGPAVGPGDPRWEPAVRRLADALAGEVRTGDGSVQGRGVFELAALLGARVPELDAGTVVAFVGDFVLLLAGHRPDSGRDWRGALAGLGEAPTG